MIKNLIYKWLFPVLLSRACDSRIPRSGDEGVRVNCFVVSLDNNGEPFFIATRYEENILYGLRWGGSSYSDEYSVTLGEIENYELRITHYYGLATITYDSIFDFAFHYVTRLKYIKIRIVRHLGSSHQYFFNRRKLVTKRRMELLEFMLNDQLDREHNGIGLFDLMAKLYSINWVLHPSADQQQQKLELYLKSLVESGELQYINHEYVVTGKAVSTLERYEEEDRRHIEAVKLQRKMVSLTILLVFMAMVQSGLIKLPALLDFSSLGDGDNSHDKQNQPTQNPSG